MIAMFELSRSDIGFGKLLVDDEGITRTKLIRRESIRWDDVREYRLRIDYTARNPYSMFRTIFDDLEDVNRALRGRSYREYQMTLFGETDHVQFNWRFRHVELAVEAALAHVEPRITAAARTLLQRERYVRFGPLAISRDALELDGDRIAREHVEQIQLLDVSPTYVRVMKRGKVWPFAKLRLYELPNPHSALLLAEELGYVIGNRELLFTVPEMRSHL
ncbi:MAG: hypothetical protein QM831_16185 [Kofleriaceae bacterium]